MFGFCGVKIIEKPFIFGFGYIFGFQRRVDGF